MNLEAPAPRWRFSRPALRSAHLARIRERLEFVRAFFPELEGVTIRVGLAQKRGVLGWGSLDADHPGVWVRPRRLDAFTIAHEFTHLLQARGLVPRGERACDLWALARSPLVIDAPPGYLRLPLELRRLRTLDSHQAAMLHRAACAALEARAAGERSYLMRFEREVAAEMRTRRRRERPAPGQQLATPAPAARRPGVVERVRALLFPEPGRRRRA
jgi:hypothetical protein